MKKIKIVSILTIILLLVSIVKLPLSKATETIDTEVNLSKLTYTVNGAEKEITKYSQDDFEKFLEDYTSGSLPEIYVTEFLFDGASMVKTYDLDDFIEDGNDAKVKTLGITAININRTGNISLSGEIKCGMIAVDTNGRTGEINLILNGVKIDTDSKKTPAILVYNKDITYTGCKVTIKTASGTKNYIEGGKFKKVSLVGSDELSNYSSKYSGDSKTWYETYTKYYGVYTSEQIENILFAKVQADNEDLADGDPYYFYKAAGAISSDIDLYFEGTGYLEVKSKNKEGIETKGNLTFSGGTGDYAIYAEDDCLNTTTTSSSNKSARNTLTIDVNSLVAIVDAGEDADEGDSIDSNGKLIINGGTIIAIAHPGQDAGLDSETGTYINGGTVLATGDMFDGVSDESKQNFIVFSFKTAQTADTLITLLNENNEAVMAYKTDRSYTNLVYSSSDFKEGTYYLYKNGEIEGTQTNGYYTDITKYTKGTHQGYSMTGTQGGMPGGKQNNGMSNGNVPDGTNSSQGTNMLPENMQNGGEGNERKEPPTGEIPSGKNENMDLTQSGDRNMNPPENGDNNGTPPSENNSNMNNPGMMNIANSSVTNKEFKVSGISNIFSGVADFTESTNNENVDSNDNQNKGESNDAKENETAVKEDDTTAKTVLPQTGVVSIIAVIIGALVVLAIALFNKNRKIKLK